MQCGVGVPAVSSASWAVLDSSERPVAIYGPRTQQAVFCFNQQALGTYHASSKHWLVGWNIFIFYPNGMRISIDVRILFSGGLTYHQWIGVFLNEAFCFKFLCICCPQNIELWYLIDIFWLKLPGIIEDYQQKSAFHQIPQWISWSGNVSQVLAVGNTTLGDGKRLWLSGWPPLKTSLKCNFGWIILSLVNINDVVIPKMNHPQYK